MVWFPDHWGSGNSKVIFTSDGSEWWGKVDVSKIDDDARRSLLEYLKNKLGSGELLKHLGVRSKGTLTKYLKYRRRIRDEVVLKMLQLISEEEFTELIGARKRLEALGLIDRNTGKVDYALIVEMLKLSLSDAYLRKLIIEFVGKYLRDDLLKLASTRVPPVPLKWDEGFEKYLLEDKKNPVKDVETLKYYKLIFERHLEGKELSEKLVEEVKNARLGWLRVVFRHYITYLFIAGKIPEETYAWIMLYVPGRKYQREIKIREYDEGRVKHTLQYLEENNEKYYVLYRVLLESGARVKHVIEMIENWHPEEKVFIKPLGRLGKRLYCTSSFCRYYLGKLEGRKQQAWIYFSRETLVLLDNIGGTHMAVRPISKYAVKHELLYPSDMRKIAFQWMSEVLNENVVRFLQGRFGELKKQVSIAYYSNLIKEADSTYQKYLDLLVEKGINSN